MSEMIPGIGNFPGYMKDGDTVYVFQGVYKTSCDVTLAVDEISKHFPGLKYRTKEGMGGRFALYTEHIDEKVK